MSDFGAVYDYALQLEAAVPPGTMAELEAIRPACLGLTRKQKEEAEKLAEKLAAMSPEDRIKAEAEIAKKKEESRAKAEEAAAKRAAQAQQQTAPASAAAHSAAPHTEPAPKK